MAAITAPLFNAVDLLTIVCWALLRYDSTARRCTEKPNRVKNVCVHGAALTRHPRQRQRQVVITSDPALLLGAKRHFTDHCIVAYA